MSRALFCFLCSASGITTACISWGKFWDNPEITSFSIPARGITGIIKGTRISLIAETYAVLTPEIATFTTTGTQVTVNGITQVSGVTANTFSSTLTYRVTGTSGIVRDYTVTLLAPRLIAGLAAWYRADSLAFAEGASINPWIDSGANANNLNASIGGNLPQFRNNQLNGKPVARFVRSGPSDGISRTGVTGFSGNSFAFFVVFKHTSYNTFEQYLFFIDSSSACSGSGLGHSLRFTDWRPDINRPCSGYPHDGDPLPDTGNFHLSAASYDATSQNLRAYIDGTLTASKTITIPLATINYIALGGMASGEDKSFDGDLAEVVLYSTTLPEDNRVKISCYLSDKYALPTGESCP